MDMKTFPLKRVSDISCNLFTVGRIHLGTIFPEQFLTVFRTVFCMKKENRRFLAGNIGKIETMARKVWKTAKCQNETPCLRSSHDEPVKWLMTIVIMAVIYRFIVQRSMKQDRELEPRIECKFQEYLKFLRERRPNQSDKGILLQFNLI